MISRDAVLQRDLVSRSGEKVRFRPSEFAHLGGE